MPTSKLGFSAPAAFVTGQASDASDSADDSMLTDDVAHTQPCQHADGIHDGRERVPFIWVELAGFRLEDLQRGPTGFTHPSKHSDYRDTVALPYQSESQSTPVTLD